jgi:hypothetical protein
MTPSLERRRYPRFAVRLPFRLRRVSGGAVALGGTLLSNDVSKTGLSFTIDDPMELGQSIEVELTLTGYGPDGNDLQVRGTGYIVRAYADPVAGKYHLAATFDELPSNDELGWKQLAAALKEPQTSS